MRRSPVKPSTPLGPDQANVLSFVSFDDEATSQIPRLKEWAPLGREMEGRTSREKNLQKDEFGVLQTTGLAYARDTVDGQIWIPTPASKGQRRGVANKGIDLPRIPRFLL
jgi:hypothetical protein